MVVPVTESSQYSAALQAYAVERNYKGITIYEQALEQVIRYQIKAKTTENVRFYRGARLE
jgi:hypothetical protein